MVSKDQGIGGAIFIICALIAIVYVVLLFYPEALQYAGLASEDTSFDGIRLWVIAVPVFVAFIVIMGIGMWIGWTMATTPPPRPIEEITSEIEEEKGKEEKSEEPEGEEPQKREK